MYSPVYGSIFDGLVKDERIDIIERQIKKTLEYAYEKGIICLFHLERYPDLVKYADKAIEIDNTNLVFYYF